MAGNDLLSGGRGRDVLNARDGAGFVDVLSCGDGAGDRALADMGDRVGAGCEVVVQNDPPTGVSLTPTRWRRTGRWAPGSAALAAADPDAGDRHTFRLVAGAGSVDNGSFRIIGSQLRTARVFDFETKNRIRCGSGPPTAKGRSIERSFTITHHRCLREPAPRGGQRHVRRCRGHRPGAANLGAGQSGGQRHRRQRRPVDRHRRRRRDRRHGDDRRRERSASPRSLNLCDPGTAGFGYTVSDGRGGTDTGQVTVDIGCVDDLPTAVDDTATVLEDATATAIAGAGQRHRHRRRPVAGRRR